MARAYQSQPIRGVVIGGDFNTGLDPEAWPQEKNIPLVENAGFWNCWTGLDESERSTWISSGGTATGTLDYIFLGGLGRSLTVVSR